MGLLDMFGGSDPQTQGLLGAISGVFNASGPSLMPRSLGQVLGAGLQGYQQGQAQAQDQALGALRLQALQGELDDAERKRKQAAEFDQAARDSYLSPEQQALAAGGGPTLANLAKIPQMQGGFDSNAFLGRAMGIDPLRALQVAQSLKKTDEEFDPTPRTGRHADGSTFQYLVSKNGKTKLLDDTLPELDPNKPFTIGMDGKPQANLPYQQYELGKAKAGATNVSTKVETKAAESIASQVGPLLKASADAAAGAQGQIDAADRIIKAVNTGKLYAGPLAGGRLSIAQIGQALGIGGADDAEKIANTRQAVRGLAELTLQGRKQMSGQGAITDRESALAEKAMSGDIENLTGPELTQIANASKRAAQFTVASHQRKLQVAKGDPSTAGIAAYFDAPAMPPLPNTPSPTASGGQFSVKTPDGRTWSFKDAKSLANFKLEAGIR